MHITHLLTTTTALLLQLLLPATTAKSCTNSQDAVLLSNVRTLTLYAEKRTSHRRVPSIPQLTCVGGNAKGLYDVDLMRCRNSGAEYDAEDIQWTCQASLPPEFKLGSTEVVCEGFDGPEDPYILKGSCGVEYRLILTELGEAKYRKDFFGRRRAVQRDEGDRDARVGKGGAGGGGGGLLQMLWGLVFWGVFIGVSSSLPPFQNVGCVHQPSVLPASPTSV